jgi:hypothetical protein
MEAELSQDDGVSLGTLEEGRTRVALEIRRNPPSRAVGASSSRKTGFRRVAASTAGHNHKTTPACAPTTAACCRVLSRRLGTKPSTAVAFGRPKTPASSPWQTPRREAARHGRSCVQSCRLDFSGYCTSHFQSSTEHVHLASGDKQCACSPAGLLPSSSAGSDYCLLPTTQ